MRKQQACRVTRSRSHNLSPQAEIINRHLVDHAALFRQRRGDRLARARLLRDEQHETATSRARERGPVDKRAHLGGKRIRCY